MKRLLVIISLLAVASLAACGEFEEETIMYEGKERTVSEVEEIIADKLEVENPELDLEIDLYEETED
ncbi:hypothetical protein [Peribacillus asahii]|uniref:hypothetical protein n=1 Tax=Peribacillus asahii TaxID=228899 RepID=UPI00207946F7|nr:hypothetical protein [Peribacillus asahii]USK85707.1 hypothetical protein LIT35_03305 [Peribacillus asahii]